MLFLLRLIPATVRSAARRRAECLALPTLFPRLPRLVVADRKAAKVKGIRGRDEGGRSIWVQQSPRLAVAVAAVADQESCFQANREARSECRGAEEQDHSQCLRAAATSPALVVLEGAEASATALAPAADCRGKVPGPGMMARDVVPTPMHATVSLPILGRAEPVKERRVPPR